MASLCRWVGSLVLIASTVALMVEQFAFAASGAALALVWFLAGQFAILSDRQARESSRP